MEEKELDFEFHSAVASARLAQSNLRWHKGSQHISAGSGGEDVVAFEPFSQECRCPSEGARAL